MRTSSRPCCNSESLRDIVRRWPSRSRPMSVLPSRSRSASNGASEVGLHHAELADQVHQAVETVEIHPHGLADAAQAHLVHGLGHAVRGLGLVVDVGLDRHPRGGARRGGLGRGGRWLGVGVGRRDWLGLIRRRDRSRSRRRRWTPTRQLVHRDAVLGYARGDVGQRPVGGDPEILGRRIRTSVASYTVVGVMPRNFTQPGDTELWLPVQSWIASQDVAVTNAPAGVGVWRWYRGCRVFSSPGSRLKPPRRSFVSVAEELAANATRRRNAEMRPRLTLLRDADTRAFRAYLWLVFGTATFVLLIVCVNVASLLLARATAGSRELSLRMALGAGRSRLVRQVLVESALLAARGRGARARRCRWPSRRSAVDRPRGPAGMARAGSRPPDSSLGLHARGRHGGAVGPRPRDHRLQGRRRHGSEGRRQGLELRKRLRRVLVVAEVAVATLLLVGAGLLLRSFSNLLTVDPGFRPENVLTVTLSPQHTGTYREQTVSLSSFYRRVERRLLEIPQVVAVGGATRFPFQGDPSARSQGDIEIATDAGRGEPPPGARSHHRYDARLLRRPGHPAARRPLVQRWRHPRDAEGGRREPTHRRAALPGALGARTADSLRL